MFLLVYFLPNTCAICWLYLAMAVIGLSMAGMGLHILATSPHSIIISIYGHF